MEIKTKKRLSVSAIVWIIIGSFVSFASLFLLIPTILLVVAGIELSTVHIVHRPSILRQTESVFVSDNGDCYFVFNSRLFKYSDKYSENYIKRNRDRVVFYNAEGEELSDRNVRFSENYVAIHIGPKAINLDDECYIRVYDTKMELVCENRIDPSHSVYPFIS